jgi:hypothetical protein
MIGEHVWIRKKMTVIGFKDLPLYLPGETEKNYGKP